MKAGDPVSVRGRGVGKALEVDDDGSALVDLGDGEKPRWWSSTMAKPVVIVHAPRGVQKVNPRAAEAARLQREGLSYVQIAATMGASVQAVRGMLDKVRAAHREAWSARASSR